MTIKCNKCSNDNAVTAKFCGDCGAPLSISSTDSYGTSTQAGLKFSNLSGDGKVDFEDFKNALTISKKYASNKVNDAVILAQEFLKSDKEKDEESVKKLAESFEKQTKTVKPESQINREKFESAMTSTIDIKYAEIMSSKKESDAYLTYIDAQILTAKVRGVFKHILSVTPPQVEAACLMSEAVLAPSTKDRKNKIKAAVGVAGGTTGIGIVIAAFASALGWGASIGAVIWTAIAGSSFLGPIAWGIAGIALAFMAGYYATTSNHQTDTERFLRVLKDATTKAIEAIWPQYETEFTRAVTQADPTYADSSK
jgi:hypothetical protein